jgi:hypothetical protein
MKKAALFALSLMLWSVSLPADPLPAKSDSAAEANPEYQSDLPKVKHFDRVANQALLAMRKRAVELKVGGVAVVAYFEGDSIQSWSSKMIVVGRMKDEPAQNDKGANLLAIAYSKAAEMADTLKDSGSHLRPPLTGEFGWSGGVIARGKSGYVIAAFSGGKDNDDVSVSSAGIAELKKGL